ncbi:PQQ-binding-like beta-propeller repeat protein [Actinoplanes sp. NPDC000266]
MPVDVLWSRSLHLRSGALAASAGLVVVAERHSRLAGLDARDGELLWEQRVEGSWGTVVIAGERCFHLSQRGTLDCLDLRSGRRLWSVTGLGFSRYVTACGDSVFTGGWRGYEPLTRLSLADGSRLPLADAPTDALSWPAALDPASGFPTGGLPPAGLAASGLAAGLPAAGLAASGLAAGLPAAGLAASGFAAAGLPGVGLSAVGLSGAPAGRGAALLVAAAERAVLLLLGGSGVLLGEIGLPDPVRSPDGGRAFGVDDDGRVVFVSGARTVMAFDIRRGVDVLWRHSRDLAALPPVIGGGTMWLVDEGGVAVVDLDGGTVGHRLLQGVAGPGILVTGRALFSVRDGSVVAVGPDGEPTGLLRVPSGIDRMIAGDDGVFHVLGQGRLMTCALPGS